MPYGRTNDVDDLSRYDRATVPLWGSSSDALSRRAGQRQLAEAGAHALLAQLRGHARPAARVARYETVAAADCAPIGSLLPGRPSDESFWQVCDAASHIRWRELTGGDR